MDSILVYVAVWGIHVKLYDISLVKHGALQCSVFGSVLSPATLYCTLSDWGFTLPTLGAGKQDGVETGHGSASRVSLNVEGREGRSRVVHSDPAATIKIGGVRCLHSSLCKSHQPEPFLFLAAGYIIIRLAGSCRE